MNHATTLMLDFKAKYYDRMRTDKLPHEEMLFSCCEAIELTGRSSLVPPP